MERRLGRQPHWSLCHFQKPGQHLPMRCNAAAALAAAALAAAALAVAALVAAALPAAALAAAAFPGSNVLGVLELLSAQSG